MKDESSLSLEGNLTLEGESLDTADFAKLSPGVFLNDKVINFSLKVYHKFQVPHSSQPDFKVLSTYMFPTLVTRYSGGTPGDIDRIIKKKIIKPVASRYVIMPIHRDSDHWALAIFVNERIPLHQKKD